MKNKLISIYKKFPILSNLFLIILSGLAIVYVFLVLMDFFTEHGKYKEVPNLKNLTLNRAIDVLDAYDMRWEIADSVYIDSKAPGVIVDQFPKAASKIKSNRQIFITINALTPRMISFPNVLDISERQAHALLEAKGLKKIRIEQVNSPYEGLVLEAKINGLPISEGTKIAASSTITLVVGDGMKVMPVDSINLDEEIPVEQTEEIVDGIDFF